MKIIQNSVVDPENFQSLYFFHPQEGLKRWGLGGGGYNLPLDQPLYLWTGATP